MILMHFYSKLCTMRRHRLRGEAILVTYGNRPYREYFFIETDEI